MSSGTASFIAGGISNIESVAGYATDAASSSADRPQRRLRAGLQLGHQTANGGKISTVSSPVTSFAFAGIGNLARRHRLGRVQVLGRRQGPEHQWRWRQATGWTTRRSRPA